MSGFLCVFVCVCVCICGCVCVCAFVPGCVSSVCVCVVTAFYAW